MGGWQARQFVLRDCRRLILLPARDMESKDELPPAQLRTWMQDQRQLCKDCHQID